MQIPQIVVGIKGKDCPCVIHNCVKEQISLKKTPEYLTFSSIEQKNTEVIINFKINSTVTTPTPYKSLILTIEGKEYTIPVRIFGTREFFIIFVLQSNLHDGWNPRNMAQHFEELRGNLPSPVFRAKMGTQGSKAHGHAFLHHIGDEEELAKYALKYHYEPLEKILHSNQIPISWLIDQNVAKEFRDYFIDWHEKFGDTIGYLPPSYFYQNHINYNIKKTLEETQQLLHDVIQEVDQAFYPIYPLYSRNCGIDQWVGSIGTNWIKAAQAESLEGIWGMGWDHRSCDTSMYHRGAPWNAYKPDANQYRCTMGSGQSSTLWAFQWTVRDLVNTIGISPYGAVCFSTDLDDIRSQKILYLEREPTYYWKLVKDYYHAYINQNFDHFVFLVHQEDHDAHYVDNNEYLSLFVKELMNAKNEGIDHLTFATFEEVTAWLNLKYAPEEGNWQYLELHDTLTLSTRKKIQEKYFDPIARIYDPDDEDEIWALLNEKWPKNHSMPNLLAYFGPEALWLIQSPNAFPAQYYDYRDPKQELVKENGELFQKEIPNYTNVKLTIVNNTFQLEFDSDRKFQNFPWALWKTNYTETQISLIPKKLIWVQGEQAIVLRLEIRSGLNIFSN